jgi:hypothetical protein
MIMVRQKDGCRYWQYPHRNSDDDGVEAFERQNHSWTGGEKDSSTSLTQ